MTIAIQADVLVIGAGPAGCCAALRLLQLGHRVALAERAALPRAHIGESLTPGIANILDLLQVRHALEAVPASPASATGLAWERDDNIELRPPGGNRMVDRARFDQALFDAAARADGQALDCSAFVRLEGEPGAWRALLARAQGDLMVHARTVIDARGRRRAGRAERIATAPALLAVFADVEDHSQRNLVEALPDGWLWGARRPDGRYRIMGFGAPAVVRAHDPAAWLSAQLAASRQFRPWADAPLEGLGAFAATPELDERPFEAGYLRTGDAACAIDPLASSGVESAMRLALQAAVAAHTELSDPRAHALARRFYEERVLEMAARHAVLAQNHYRHGWPADQPFWRSRSEDFAVQPRTRDGLGARLPAEIAALRAGAAKTVPAAAPVMPPLGELSLCPLLRVIEVPCIVDDKVTLRRALAHPNLPRPVAFVGGVDLVAFLDVLAGMPHAGLAIARCTRQLGIEHAARLIGWLCANGLARQAA